jgi:hypothetical protein
VQITIQLEGFEKDDEKSKDDRGKDDLRGKELSRHETTVNKEKRAEPEESLYSEEQKCHAFSIKFIIFCTVLNLQNFPAILEQNV